VWNMYKATGGEGGSHTAHGEGPSLPAFASASASRGGAGSDCSRGDRTQPS